MSTIDKTVERIATAKLQIADTVSAGRQFKSRYLDISKRTYDRIPTRLPRWAREYLRGYAEALLDQLNRETDFRYLINGTWINARDLEYSNDCTTPQTCSHPGHIAAVQHAPAATFWKDSDRVFYQSVDNVYGR